MVTFEVYLNGKKLSTAGVGELGVLSANLAWRGSQPYEKDGPTVAEHLRLDVGGLANGEHLRWVERKLKRGDTLTVKITEASSAEKPRKRQRPDPVADLRARKQYVRRLAKEFGWKILR
jgi:hypothetical protein